MTLKHKRKYGIPLLTLLLVGIPLAFLTGCDRASDETAEEALEKVLEMIDNVDRTPSHMDYAFKLRGIVGATQVVIETVDPSTLNRDSICSALNEKIEALTSDLWHKEGLSGNQWETYLALGIFVNQTLELYEDENPSLKPCKLSQNLETWLESDTTQRDAGIQGLNEIQKGSQ